MSVAVFIALLVILAVLITYHVHRAFQYFEKRNFPFAQPEFLIGNIRGVGTSIHFSQVLLKFYKQCKGKAPAFGMFFFNNPVLVLTDLDLIKNVLIKDFNNFHDRGLYVNTETDPLSGHLFAIEGAEWRNMRNKLSPTFTSGKMKMMFGSVLQIAQEMVENLKNVCSTSKKIEMNDIVTRFTTDVIGNVAFGLEMNSTKNSNAEFHKMGQKVFNASSLQTLRLMFITAFKNFSKTCGFRFFSKEISDFFMTSIKETVEYREKNGVVRNDFLNLLLELKKYGKLKDDEGEATEKLTFEELAAQAFVFFLAGFETSSTTMAFALYELALNQDVQEKTRQEIRKVIEKHSGKLTYEAMKEMKYLHMVIDETLRLYPPLDLLMRMTVADYKIPGTELIIEKGTPTITPSFAIQRDPDLYPEPNEFLPERFSDKNKAQRHPMAHIPFGAGNRNCLGMRFGYMQTKLGLISLLLNFKFSPSNKTTIPMKFLPKSQTLAPIDRMWLCVEKI